VDLARLVYEAAGEHVLSTTFPEDLDARNVNNARHLHLSLQRTHHVFKARFQG
jgi:hypothetical protein